MSGWSDRMISCRSPSQALRPFFRKMMWSPISITEFISWVLITVVIPYSWVISRTRLSMTTAVCGSSPELGSSQKRYLGFMAMERAMATRFIIPPEISAGYFLLAPSSLTRFRQKSTRSFFSPGPMRVNIFRGNMTFSSTVRLSNKALPWKTIPIS